MTTVSNLIFPTYNLIRGRDFFSSALLEDEDAKMNAEKLLLEVFKITGAVGGYFSVTLAMAVMATPIQAFIVGAFVLGFTHSITSRCSVILHDTTRITIGIIILKKGLIDLAVEPFIQAIKIEAGYTTVVQATAAIPAKVDPVAIGTNSMAKILFTTLGIPFLRFSAGMASLAAGGAFILDDVNPKNEEFDTVIYNNQPHLHFDGQGTTKPAKPLVDRAILWIVNVAADGLIRIRGYKVINSQVQQN